MGNSRGGTRNFDFFFFALALLGNSRDPVGDLAGYSCYKLLGGRVRGTCRSVRQISNIAHLRIPISSAFLFDMRIRVTVLLLALWSVVWAASKAQDVENSMTQLLRLVQVRVLHSYNNGYVLERCDL